MLLFLLFLDMHISFFKKNSFQYDTQSVNLHNSNVGYIYLLMVTTFFIRLLGIHHVICIIERFKMRLSSKMATELNKPFPHHRCGATKFWPILIRHKPFQVKPILS